MSKLTDAQVKRALVPVRPSKVEVIQGASYVPHHEVRAELCRMFGPTRWDSQTQGMTLLYETEEELDGGKKRWRVAYMAAVQLRVRDLDGKELATYREYHSDESIHPSRGEAHANAMTSAQSVALRRAAINIGDNMGLHLYDNGSRVGIVKDTLLNDQVPGAADAPLSPEQTKTLQDSLGAQVVSEERTEPQPAASESEPPPDKEGHPDFTNRIDTPEQAAAAVKKAAAKKASAR